MKEGFDVLDSIYKLSADFEQSRMYPGIPEYINEKGRGMYTYLTGSASWLLLTQLTEVFGVKGYYGDLQLEPKLMKPQFDVDGKASVETLFAGRMLRIVYCNPQGADYGAYRIQSVTLNGESLPFVVSGEGCLIQRSAIEKLSEDGLHGLEIGLGQ
ncbi:hypothetical protein D3C76_1278830 [compost metagenome]